MIWRTQWSKLLICVRNIHHGRGGHESIFQIHISIQLMRSFNFFSDILRPHGVALRAPPRLLGRPKEHRPPPHPDDGNHRIREGGPGTHHLTMASNVKDFNPLERLQSISQIIAKYQKNLLLKLFLLVKVRTSSYKLRLLYEPKTLHHRQVYLAKFWLYCRRLIPTTKTVSHPSSRTSTRTRS